MYDLFPVLGVDKDKCVNCHSCIAVCPVKYCNDASGETVEVVHNMCIACGSCLEACTHEARYFIDDFINFLQDCARGDKIIAIVAPSAAANFPNQYLNFNGWLKSIGVDAIFDVSFGAELTVQSYLNHIDNNDPKLVIAQPCPAIVTYIQLYQPELIQHLAPADSPMVHTIKMVKKFYPKYQKHKVVIISPCMAKKREFQMVEMGDYVVAIKSTDVFFEKNNINLSQFPAVDYDNPPAERAVMFSSPGGLLQTVERSRPELKDLTRKIEGPNLIYDYLKKLPEIIKKGINPLLIDCLSCEFGCNAGPLTLVKHKSVDEIEHLISLRKKEMKAIYDKKNVDGDQENQIEQTINRYWEAGLYDRSYANLWENVKLKYPNDKELTEIYRSMHKYSDKDIYNCSSCGYGECKIMATAIFNGLNRPENCHFYLTKETEISHEETEESNNKIANILDTSLDGFLEINTDSIIINANPALKKILKREDIIGRSLFDFLDDVNKEILHKQLDLREKNESNSYELTLLQSDEQAVYCLISASPLYNKENQKTGSFAMVSDITNLKLAERELRKTNEELEDRVVERTVELTESLEELKTTTEIIEEKNIELEKLSIVASKTDNAILIMDREGNIEWLNEGFANLYEYTLNELYAQKGRSIFDVSSSDKIHANYNKSIDTKKSVHYEVLVTTKSGRKLWTQTTLTPILDKNNEVIKLVSIDSDISTLKEAEDEILQQKEEILAQAEALIKSEKNLLDIIKFLPDAVMVIDQTRCVIAWNKSMEVLTGVKKHSIIGLGNYEYSVPFFNERQPILIDYIFQPNRIPDNSYNVIEHKDSILVGEVSCKLYDNKTHYLIMTAAPLGQNTDDIEGAILVVKDFTERKKSDDDLKEANHELIQKNQKITYQQNNITDSIVYASKIQNALLPSKEALLNNFPEHFVMFQPRDIVSGDFYWVQEINQKVIFAAADCTGHGVPGALMSMLGIAFLNDIVKSNKLIKPSEILDELRNMIKTSLHQTDKGNVAKDGMDIALCVYDTETKILQFSGAHNPVYIIRNNSQPEIEGLSRFKKLTYRNDTLTQINADSQPIGIHLREYPFTNHEIQLLKDDRLYVFSDGFFDQVGGLDGKKYMSKHFKTLLLKNHKAPLSEQKEALKKTFDEWKGSKDQVDDVLVIGIGIG